MDAKVLEGRRRDVMAQMGGGVAIIPTAPRRTRNRDIEYPFRPDSDFYYLTHFHEPDAVAVLVPGRAHGEYLLFCRDRDAEKELWEGRRAGIDGARQYY
ncbi:MAG: Xaa-Pro aminopeptidase, partial [Burkholderiales bacterium]|nr:Xaa-Pro aminopeptidase [Burkholderiales bacterium]